MATYSISSKEINRRKRRPFLWALVGPLVGMADYGRNPDSPEMAFAFGALVALLIAFFHWKKSQPFLYWAQAHSFHIESDHFIIQDMNSRVSIPFASIRRVLVKGEKGAEESVALVREKNLVYELPLYDDFDALMSELEAKLDPQIFVYGKVEA
ncbi:MAG: hypothetical protein L3J26_07740 [Candidatus Polarisedimenticolaceae bacterium]|nr:hypothetical protein [Candidatus Polarisedimenticolaceae bacterium]